MATTYPSATRRHRRLARGDAAATQTETGISLARGPALILGTILLAAGLYFMYKAHTFPRFSNFPNGTAHRDGNFFFGIFGSNGWTGLFTAVCGGLLLFGAAEHLLAKTMSLIVGLALGAAAVIAVISGDVLGMAAANGWTELGWGVCAVILLFNSMIPRRRHTVVAEDAAMAGTGTAAAPVAERPVAERPVATTAGTTAGTTAAAEPMAADRHGATTGTGGGAPATMAGGEPLVTRADEPGARRVE